MHEETDDRPPADEPMLIDLTEESCPEALIKHLPARETQLFTFLLRRFKSRVVDQAFADLMRCGEIERTSGDYIQQTAQAPERAKLRQQATEALGPILDFWHFQMPDMVIKREIMRAILSRFEMSTKYCSGCRQRRRRDTEFDLNAAKRDGLQSVCRACRKERK